MARKTQPSLTSENAAPARGSVGTRVMMHLLKERPTIPSARRLADQFDAGHSQVAQIVNLLQFHRALREVAEGLAVEWRQLARVMAALRVPDIVPRRTFALSIDAAALHRKLETRSIRHAFGFTTAANLIAYFEPHPETCIIVEQSQLDDLTRLARDDGLPEGPPFAKLHPSGELPRGSSRLFVFTERLDKLDITQTKSGPSTSLHQTYVDLLQFPLAGAHADFLERAIEARWQREHPETREE